MYHRGVEEGGWGGGGGNTEGGNRGVFCETGSCGDQGPLFGYSSTAERTMGYVKDVGEGMQLKFTQKGVKDTKKTPGRW